MLFLALSVFTVIINIPFGVWRATRRKFSLQWFLAIHLPIPLIVIFRYVAGYGLAVIPLLLILAILGQIIGGKIFHFSRRHERAFAKTDASDTRSASDQTGS